MAVYDFDAFAYDDVSEDREEGEDGGEGGLAVDYEEGDVVDFEPVGQISHACSSLVGMSDNNDFVATVNEFLILSGWSCRQGLGGH
jgi:hypothetical protein